MINLKYCPKCGKETLLWDSVKKWTCSNCDFVLYNNVAGAVAVIIKFEQEILLTRRNQDPKSGKLDLPGGFVDPQESAEDTCFRELKEELSIEIDPTRLRFVGSLPNTYEYKDVLYNTIDLFYEYELNAKGNLKLELSEISETVWIGQRDLNLDDLAFESQKIFLQKHIQS